MPRKKVPVHLPSAAEGNAGARSYDTNTESHPLARGAQVCGFFRGAGRVKDVCNRTDIQTYFGDATAYAGIVAIRRNGERKR